jgi:hypothetical protein
MSSLRKKGLALWSNEEAGERGSTDIITTAAPYEDAVADIDSTVVAVEDDITGIEDLQEGANELGEVKERMDDSIEAGTGMSEETAEMAEIAVEAICSKIGLRGHAKRVMISTESFGSTNTRLQSTRFSAESIGDTIKKIWEAIKTAIKNVWDRIKNFFNGLVGSAKKASEHIESLKKRVNELPLGGEKSKEKLDSGSLAKAFTEDGEAGYNTAIAILIRSTALLGKVD